MGIGDDHGTAGPAWDEGDPLFLIEGERVALGPLRRDLLPVLARWNNDFRISRTTAGMPPLSLEHVTTLYERAVTDEGTASFMIYDRASGRPIRTTYLEGIDLRHASSQLRVTHPSCLPWQENGPGTNRPTHAMRILTTEILPRQTGRIRNQSRLSRTPDDVALGFILQTE